MKRNSEDEKQPEDNSFVSLDTKKVQTKFMKRWVELAGDTGRGYVTAYMFDKKCQSIIVHIEDRE